MISKYTLLALILLVSQSTARRKLRTCIQPQSSTEPCDFPIVPHKICHQESCSINDMDTCTIANLAILAEFDIFDVVLLHSGSCLGEIPRGELHRETLESILRNDELVGLQVNGSDLLAAFEEGFHAFYDEGESDLYPKASGIRFQINPNAPFGDRIRNPKIMNKHCTWKPVKPWMMYDVLTVRSLLQDYRSLSKSPREPMPSKITVPQAVFGYAQRSCALQNPYVPFQPLKNESSTVTI